MCLSPAPVIHTHYISFTLDMPFKSGISTTESYTLPWKSGARWRGSLGASDLREDPLRLRPNVLLGVP